MIEFKTANKDQIKHMYKRFVPDKMDQFNDFYKSIKNIKLTIYSTIFSNIWIVKTFLNLLMN